MGPLAMLTLTGGVITQVGFVIVRIRPAFDLLQRLVACLQNPQQPPAQPITVEDVMEVVEELLQNPQKPSFRSINAEDVTEVTEELLQNPQQSPVRLVTVEDVLEVAKEPHDGGDHSKK